MVYVVFESKDESPGWIDSVWTTRPAAMKRAGEVSNGYFKTMRLDEPRGWAL